MADNSNTLVARFNGYSRQPATRQIALLLGLAASIALGIGLVRWAMLPNYKPLYGAMSGEDTNQVISALEANGFDYRMDNRSGMVAVAADQVHRARLILASEGYPRGDGVGFESLYKEQEIGVSSFMEQARFHRALEQELSRTVGAMEGVRAARVHLAMAKQSAFLRQREKPAASVMLHLYAGHTLNDRQLAGVVHLVSSSVPNLEAEQVSVVDQQGRLLSNQGSDEAFGYTQEQYRLAQQLEQRYGQRIVDILEPILGPGKVRAQVAADIDFTRVERTSEQYAPETVMRSEQTTEETSSGTFSAGGVPGTLSNQPPAESQTVAQAPPLAGTEAAGAVEQTAPERISRRATRNYEMDKTISHIRETPGSLNKLSVAVVLDYAENVAEDGSVERVPLEQARIDELTSLVREAVGFNADRGDSVSVINASFIAQPEMEPLEGPSLLEQEWVWRSAKGVMAGLAFVALVFVVLRPIMQFSAASVAPSAPALAGPGAQAALPAGGYAGGVEVGEDQVTLAGQQYGLPGGYQQQLQMARNLAEGEPQRAAYVVKEWVGGDG